MTCPGGQEWDRTSCKCVCKRKHAYLLTSGIQQVAIASAQQMATASGLRFGTKQHASANVLLAKELSAHATTAFLVLPVSSGPTTSTASVSQLSSAKLNSVPPGFHGVLRLATVNMVESDHLRMEVAMDRRKEDLTDPPKEAQTAALMDQVLVAIRIWEEIHLTRVFQMEIE